MQRNLTIDPNCEAGQRRQVTDQAAWKFQLLGLLDRPCPFDAVRPRTEKVDHFQFR